MKLPLYIPQNQHFEMCMKQIKILEYFLFGEDHTVIINNGSLIPVLVQCFLLRSYNSIYMQTLFQFVYFLLDNINSLVFKHSQIFKITLEKLILLLK